MGIGLFTAEWLRQENWHGFGKLPIPQPRDLQMSQLLRDFRKMDAAQRQRELENVRDEDRFVYLSYSERMATLAVRRTDRELIVLGLIANGIDGWRVDFRDNMLILPLHYDAAMRCGFTPTDVFDEAAAYLAKVPADVIRPWPRDAPDKSLAAMGYVADTDSDGFRYRRTW